MKNTFFNEEKELMTFYIQNYLFSPEKTMSYLLLHLDEYNPINYDLCTEIIVKPDCNQKCEYCYIAKFGKDLYPFEERVSNEELLKNLNSLLDYIYTQKESYVNHWELFAGDLFYDDFYFDILDVFYKHLEPLHKKYYKLFSKMPIKIVTPSNFSFIQDAEKLEKLEKYITQFYTINCELGFSISTDGPYATEFREKREINEEYFNKMFEFITRHPAAGMHPMISSSNVKYAIDNYKWFREKYDEYFKDMNYAFIPMFLEVRNDEWTKENIANLLKLEDYMIEDRLKYCNNNIDLMARMLWGHFDEKDKYSALWYNDIIDIYFKNDLKVTQGISCSMQKYLHITLNNLAFPICHRLNYKQFRGGKFELNDEGQITGIIPQNPSIYLMAKFFPVDKTPRCLNCNFNEVCQMGCLGAQFEAMGDLFIPCQSVCDMKIQKITHLVTKYYQMGLFDSAIRQGLLDPTQINILEHLLQVCNVKGVCNCD